MSKPKGLSPAEPSDSRDDEHDGKSWDERWLLPYVEDLTLWPVLLVLIAHFAAFVAPVLLMTVRDHRVSGLIAMLGLLFLSVQIIRYELGRRGKLGALTGVLLSTWALSVAAAVVAHRTGFL